jgi:hypothetical protein
MNQTDPLTQAQLNYVFMQLDYRLTEVKMCRVSGKTRSTKNALKLPAILQAVPARQHFCTTS